MAKLINLYKIRGDEKLCIDIVAELEATMKQSIQKWASYNGTHMLEIAVVFAAKMILEATKLDAGEQKIERDDFATTVGAFISFFYKLMAQYSDDTFPDSGIKEVLN